MKDSGPQNTTTKQEPWEGAKPYWLQTYADIYGTPQYQGQAATSGRTAGTAPSFNRGGIGMQTVSGIQPRGVGLPAALQNAGYNKAANFVPQGAYGDKGLLGTTQFVGTNPNIQSAWDMTQARAGAPSQMLTGAEDYATRVLSGEFLDPTKNLAMAQSLQRGMEDLGAWDTSAIQAGRYGGGAWGAGRGRQLADLQGNLYGQGLQQMTQMAGMAPSIYEAGYLPASKMLALGDAQRQMGQEEQLFPWEMRGMAANLLSGAPGGTTIGQYYKPNPLMGALGGAAAGSAFGPWGAAIGGGLGLLGAR